MLPVTATSRRAEGLATAAAALGVVSVPFAVLILPGVLAIVFGLMARPIRRAWVGIVLGTITVVAGAAVWVTVVPGILDTTSYRNLAVGDCYHRPGDDPTHVRRQSCGDHPDRAVIAVLEHPAPPGAQWPGWEVLRRYANETCQRAAERHVGESLATSGLKSYTIYPTREGWAGGNRRIVCAVGHDDRVGRLP